MFIWEKKIYNSRSTESGRNSVSPLQSESKVFFMRKKRQEKLHE